MAALLIPLISLSIPHVSLATPVRRQSYSEAPWSRLIVFGNSYSDNGTGAWEVSQRTWPADSAYADHRFSNGPVWPEYLANTLGIPLLDYAAGGATIDNTFVTGTTGSDGQYVETSTTEQVEAFLAENKVQSGDIFVHYIGINDIFFDPSITGGEITSLIARNIDTLFRAGAQTMVMGNYPVADSVPGLYGSLDYIGDEAASSYAATLKSGLYDIAASFEAYMQIGVADVEALFGSIVADPQAFGICSEYVNPPTACLKGAYASEGVPRSLCSDPERHLFFDSYHPVTQVHELMAGVFHAALLNLK